jgi:RNA polymerase sigma-70 factor (ECF subfamily)
MPGAFDRLSDQDLIAVCNDGDAEDAAAAFNALYRRHKNYVVRLAMRFVNDHDVALDVLQETFSYILRKLPPPGPGIKLNAKMTTLLYPVAKNLAITQLRKAGRFDAGEDPDSLPAPEVDDGDDLDHVLRALSAERREVLMLRFVDDLSLQEIADTLDIPLGTVKSRLHLGIRELRDSPDIRKIYFS